MAETKEQRAEFWASLSPKERVRLEREKRMAEIESPNFNHALVERAKKRMARVDSLPADIREVIYEYNLEVVQEFLNHGVRKAKSIKHLIDTVTGADFINGQPRFKLNKAPNAKRNEIDLADDDDYYVIAKKP